MTPRATRVTGKRAFRATVAALLAAIAGVVAFRAPPGSDRRDSSAPDAAARADADAVAEPVALDAGWHGEPAVAPAFPVTHLGRRAIYQDFGDVAAVGPHAVLVGCRRLRLLGEKGKPDLPLPWPRPDATHEETCPDVVASDASRIFLHTDDGVTLAYDVEAARVAWTRLEASARGHQGVVVGPALAMLGAYPAYPLEALDRATGEVLWSARANAEAGVARNVPTFAAAGDRLVEIGAGSTTAVRARDAATGAVLWEAPLGCTERDPCADRQLAADPDEVAILVDRTRLVLLDAATGGIRAERRRPELQKRYGQHVELIEGGLYLATADAPGQGDGEGDAVERLDRQSGAVLWRTEGAGAQLLGVGDALVTRGRGDVLRALDPARGEVVWTFGVGSLRQPEYWAYDDPLRVVPDVSDLAHAGQELVVAVVGNVRTQRQVTTLARGEKVVAPRTVTVDVRLELTDGGAFPDPARRYDIYGHKVSSEDDGGVRTKLTGRGVVVVLPEPQGAGDTAQASAFDLENGKSSYAVKIPYDENFTQGCQ